MCFAVYLSQHNSNTVIIAVHICVSTALRVVLTKLLIRKRCLRFRKKIFNRQASWNGNSCVAIELAVRNSDRAYKRCRERRCSRLTFWYATIDLLGARLISKWLRLPVVDFNPLEMSLTESQHENRQKVMLIGWLLYHNHCSVCPLQLS